MKLRAALLIGLALVGSTAQARTPPRPGFKPGFQFLTAPVSSLILDQLSTTATSAYSTRKLKAAYAGSAIRVQRTSDTTQSDIGFNGTYTLDTVALAAFCAATTCSVVTWYDQSGNGHDATQATVANQPIIVSSGTIQTLNFIPALRFVSSSGTTYDELAGFKFTGTGTAWTFAEAGASDAVTGFSHNTFWTDGYGYQVSGIYVQNDAPLREVANSSGANTLAQLGTANPVASQAEIMLGTSDTGNNFTGYRNGEVAAPVATTFVNSVLTNAYLGTTRTSSGVNASQSLTGYIGEHISWGAVLSSGDITTYLANARTYWGTP